MSLRIAGAANAEPRVLEVGDQVRGVGKVDGLASGRAVAAQAEAKGLAVPQDFFTSPMPEPIPLLEGCMDLGGMTAMLDTPKKIIRKGSANEGHTR